MALSCFGEVMASIAPNCDSPLAGGYTGRGILIPADAITAVTASTSNPRILEAITASTVIGIENAVVTPFDGSTTASSADDGKMSFGKTIVFRIALRGAATARTSSNLSPTLLLATLPSLRKRTKSVTAPTKSSATIKV